MYSFLLSIAALVIGYLIYGKITERVFGIDQHRKTPALANPDGVDFVALPWWKVFLIQFLNIAGLGPIFGAVMGVMFGAASFLWIVLGTIFAGAVHDFLSGMMSVRANGASQSELVGMHLGKFAKQFMRVFSLMLMILVGAVFVSGPAGLLAKLTPDAITVTGWIVVVFAYYIVATLLPIDKIIGKIYPVFGFALLFMAVGIFFALILNRAPIPEFTDGLSNLHPQSLPIFPVMFITIACGAISGFHATQSPLMARCIQNEKYGRRIFYGSMVAEGIVALIWAAAAASFYGSIQELQAHAASLGNVNVAAHIVDEISRSWLGPVGGLLALLGVIAAPLTSGDTALRSARLIAANFMNFNQKPIFNRLVVSIPIFILTFLVLQMDFSVLWRYFAWSNQTLAMFTLWAITVYLAKNKRNYVIALFPALFMTSVTVSYIGFAPEGFGMPYWLSIGAGLLVTAASLILFLVKRKKLI